MKKYNHLYLLMLKFSLPTFILFYLIANTVNFLYVQVLPVLQVFSLHAFRRARLAGSQFIAFFQNTEI